MDDNRSVREAAQQLLNIAFRVRKDMEDVDGIIEKLGKLANAPKPVAPLVKPIVKQALKLNYPKFKK